MYWQYRIASCSRLLSITQHIISDCPPTRIVNINQKPLLCWIHYATGPGRLTTPVEHHSPGIDLSITLLSHEFVKWESPDFNKNPLANLKGGVAELGGLCQKLLELMQESFRDPYCVFFSNKDVWLIVIDTTSLPTRIDDGYSLKLAAFLIYANQIKPSTKMDWPSTRIELINQKLSELGFIGI